MRFMYEPNFDHLFQIHFSRSRSIVRFRSSPLWRARFAHSNVSVLVKLQCVLRWDRLSQNQQQQKSFATRAIRISVCATKRAVSAKRPRCFVAFCCSRLSKFSSIYFSVDCETRTSKRARATVVPLVAKLAQKIARSKWESERNQKRDDVRNSNADKIGKKRLVGAYVLAILFLLFLFLARSARRQWIYSLAVLLVSLSSAFLHARTSQNRRFLI